MISTPICATSCACFPVFGSITCSVWWILLTCVSTNCIIPSGSKFLSTHILLVTVFKDSFTKWCISYRDTCWRCALSASSLSKFFFRTECNGGLSTEPSNWLAPFVLGCAYSGRAARTLLFRTTNFHSEVRNPMRLKYLGLVMEVHRMWTARTKTALATGERTGNKTFWLTSLIHNSKRDCRDEKRL
jgi:hypothetical protein